MKLCVCSEITTSVKLCVCSESDVQTHCVYYVCVVKLQLQKHDLKHEFPQMYGLKIKQKNILYIYMWFD